VISEGVTGYLVGDAGEAARCLQRVPQIDRKACRERVEQRFSVDTMVQQYEHVYLTVLETEARKMT
jgi:glycosyltransferase involved in cell wall biosynthesis